MTTSAPVKRGPGRPKKPAPGPITDDLKAEIEEIVGEIDSLSETEIRRRYQLGGRLAAIIDDDSGRYGTDAEATLKDALPLSKGSLNTMVAFARAYETADVDRLVGLRNQTTNEGLTWDHVAALPRLKDKDRALALAETAVTKGWSSKELVKEVIRKAGGPRSKGGRRAKKAGSLAALLGDVRDKVKAWTNAATQSWLAPGGLDDLYVESLGSGKRPTQETVEALDAALADLDAFAVHVRAVASQVNRVLVQARSAREPRAVA